MHMTNTRITDPEILERRYPVILRAFRLRSVRALLIRMTSKWQSIRSVFISIYTYRFCSFSSNILVYFYSFCNLFFQNSGGSGYYRGGDGVERTLEFLRPLTVSILSERRSFQPCVVFARHCDTLVSLLVV